MRKGFRQPRAPKVSELVKQQSKLHAKYKEYSEKTTEELNEMLKILGGGYKDVCLHILKERFIAGLKANQSEELPDGKVK